MNTTPEYQINELLKFVYGEMNEQELAACQDQISRDPDLAMTIDGMNKFREDYGFESAADHLQWLEEQQHDFDLKLDESIELEPATIRPMRWVYVAAAIVVLLITWVLISDSQEVRTPAELFLAYDSPPPFVLDRSTKSGTEDAYRNLTRWYQAGNYEETLIEIERLNRSDSANSDLQFYEAYCYLQSGKAQEAIQRFMSFTDQQNHRFANRARWYSGLAYLKQGDTDQAIPMLQSISGPDDLVSQANKILKELSP